MGFALAAMASARRGTWVAAGFLIALAFLSQQFTVLVAAPLVVLAPATRRFAYAGAAVVTVLVAALPLLLTNAHGATHAILFGTGNTGGIGGTVLWELSLHGIPLLVLSRFAPIGLSLVLTWWVVRRLGPASLEPVGLISLVAVSLGLRLVFEQQLFGYYFMALSVTLVLLDVVRGHIRSSLVAWLATVSMVFLLGSSSLELIRKPWQAVVQDFVPLSVMLLAAFLFVRRLRRGEHDWMLALYAGMIVSAVLSWDDIDFLGHPPAWFWQVVLVPLGIALAAGPLLSTLQHRELQPQEVAPFPPALE